jgi:flagellar secretion chaperone FliS
LYGNKANEYRKGAVNGASPLQLVIMLYDGALRFMAATKHAMAQKDYDAQNVNSQKAQRIIMELMGCLDMQQGAEIAQNLLAIYTFVLNTLVEANIKDDPKSIDACAKILSDLRESWVALDASTRTTGGEESLAA